MTAARRRLGNRLAGWTALATAVAVLVFASTAAVVLWRHELGEERAGDVEDEPAVEALEQLTIALAVTTPVVIALAAFATRRLTRRVTDRLDGVVAAAHRMTSERLGERLPVSGAGDEIDELAAALNGLFARLDHGLAAQRQFVADASHELRTPLAVLRSELEVARRRPRAGTEWEAVADRAIAEVVRMTSMVEALLRLASAGAGPPGVERIDGRALVDGVVDRWQAAASAASIELAIQADDEAAVTGDGDALAVALGNLVGNAIAHSPAGGRVDVAARRVGAAVELVVEDQGPGVPAADRERIFRPFARGADAADRGGPGGVGLGLSVAGRIAEAHRGDLRVEDAAGGGARFVLRVPAAS